VARAYAQSSTRKKLVVMAEATGTLKRLARRYQFLHFVGPRGRREELSLLKSAAVIIIAGAKLPQETLLQIMDSGGAVVAETVPRYEETLGVSASFVKRGDTAGLTEALNDVVMRKERQTLLGRGARRRAAAHFTWTRIIPEYLDLYHAPAAQPVALDSAQASFAQAEGAR
jgi:glycosyltransferase involved in cell wall biosynthesis